MNKDVLENLRDTVQKNIETIQKNIERCKSHPPGVDEKEELRYHHTLMRYAKLLMSIENRLTLHH